MKNLTQRRKDAKTQRARSDGPWLEWLMLFIGFGLLGLMLASFGCQTSVDQSLVTSAATGNRSLLTSAATGNRSLLTSAATSPTITWENEPLWAESQYAGWCVLSGFTGIQGSTDLVHWVELARLPYEQHCSVILSNRPAREFYRAFTGWNAAKLK